MSEDYLLASNECAHLQRVIAYLEVSSRDYLITSNKRAHLQCDTIEVKRVLIESWFKRTEARGKVSAKLYFKYL